MVGEEPSSGDDDGPDEDAGAPPEEPTDPATPDRRDTERGRDGPADGEPAAPNGEAGAGENAEGRDDPVSTDDEAGLDEDVERPPEDGAADESGTPDDGSGARDDIADDESGTPDDGSGARDEDGAAETSTDADLDAGDASLPAAADGLDPVESATTEPDAVEGGPAADGAAPVAVEEDDDWGDGLFGSKEGPEGDREMPLADHIEEMVKRLAIVIAIAGVVSLLVFPFAEQIINFLWYHIMPGAPGDIARPRLYGILELWFTRVKVASLAGLIVALPVLVYETYAFMRPGLYPHERRYYLAAIPTSLVLALVGVSFAYFVVLPSIFAYFFYYTQGVALVGFALGRTFDLILLLMGYMALVFQIPLFLMLAMMMGLASREWIADRRLLFWGAFLGIAFLFSPDPTGMAPILVAATMIVLFEGTLLLTRWTGRSRGSGSA